ncbi:MAG: hypothetical protein HC888_05445 [Candidatus Competibacteraceae bacterium]|nr:hypothetical protein [Candidatus Competibacteraceae bacterium]
MTSIGYLTDKVISSEWMMPDPLTVRSQVLDEDLTLCELITRGNVYHGVRWQFLVRIEYHSLRHVANLVPTDGLREVEYEFRSWTKNPHRRGLTLNWRI